MKEVSYESPKLGGSKSKNHATRSIGSDAAPTLRTFRSDVEKHFREHATTRTQVALAESDRHEARGESRTPREGDGSGLGRIIFLLALVLAFGIGVGAYALIGTRSTGSFLEQATSTEPGSTTDELGIILTDSPREQILADISIAFGKTSLSFGEKRSLVFLVKEATGESRHATVAEFFGSVIPAKPIEDLLRSLNTDLNYEIRSHRTLSGGMTLSSRSYANSFTAMLRFEDTMGVDLLPVLNPWYDRERIKHLQGIRFNDEQLGGVEVRVLSDATGIPVIVYGFSDKKTLIIAGSKDAFMTTSAAIGNKR